MLPLQHQCPALPSFPHYPFHPKARRTPRRGCCVLCPERGHHFLARETHLDEALHISFIRVTCGLARSTKTQSVMPYRAHHLPNLNIRQLSVRLWTIPDFQKPSYRRSRVIQVEEKRLFSARLRKAHIQQCCHRIWIRFRKGDTFQPTCPHRYCGVRFTALPIARWRCFTDAQTLEVLVQPRSAARRSRRRAHRSAGLSHDSIDVRDVWTQLARFALFPIVHTPLLDDYDDIPFRDSRSGQELVSVCESPRVDESLARGQKIYQVGLVQPCL